MCLVWTYNNHIHSYDEISQKTYKNTGSACLSKTYLPNNKRALWNQKETKNFPHPWTQDRKAFLSASSPSVETLPKRSVLSSQRQGQGCLEPSAHLIPSFLVCLKEADPLPHGCVSQNTGKCQPPFKGLSLGVPVSTGGDRGTCSSHGSCCTSRPRYILRPALKRGLVSGRRTLRQFPRVSHWASVPR